MKYFVVRSIVLRNLFLNSLVDFEKHGTEVIFCPTFRGILFDQRFYLVRGVGPDWRLWLNQARINSVKEERKEVLVDA
jgi:hypothetical protein